MNKRIHVTDLNVEKFYQLKKVRDATAHGKLSQPNGAVVIDIEKLALLIQENC